MKPAIGPHPTATVLGEYALGKLAAADTEVIATHLEDCEACRKFVEAVPADSLLALLKPGRASGGAGSHRNPEPRAEPAKLATTLNRSEDSGPSVSGPTASLAAGTLATTEIPAGLVNHPRYRIIRVLGQGGICAVFLAEHTVMRQMRVIKVVKPALVDSPTALERFRREVKTAAILDHPNIVRAFDAEQSGSTHYLVMDFVEGHDLAELLERNGPLPVVHACDYVRQAALGLQHAHEKNTVHRDLKPQHLMLTPKGVIKILDFGLAKVRSEAAQPPGQTVENTMMGTPDYMAPEQWMEAHTAAIQADVYSLGCTLYALLTGAPPFKGEALPIQTMAAHLHAKPKPVHEVCPEVRADLSALVDRLLAKSPEDRPQTPADVANALLPFIKRSDPSGPTFCQDSPPPLLEEEAPGPSRRVELESQPEEPVKEVSKSRLLVVSFLTSSALAGMIGGLIYHGAQQAERAVSEQRPAEVDPRSVPHLTCRGHTEGLLSVCYSPDGKLLASGSGDSTVRLWDANTGSEVRTLRGHVKPVWRVAFSPDGRRVASASNDETVRVWDATTGQELLVLRGPLMFRLRALAFSPNGKWLAAGGYDRNVIFWDATTGERTKCIVLTDLVYGLAFSPDGSRVATSGSGLTSQIKVWDLTNTMSILTIPTSAFTLAYSPDGTLLASGLADTARIWDAATGKEISTLKGHEASVLCVAFSPDGRRLATASDDRTVKLWDLRSAKEVATFLHTDDVEGVAFSPDGHWIASGAGSDDRRLNVWDAFSTKRRIP